MSRYSDDLLEAREFYDHSEGPSEDFSSDDDFPSHTHTGALPNELVELRKHQRTHQNSLVRKPNWDDYSQNELNEILLTLTGVGPPSHIENSIYISNLETAKAYLSGDMLRSHLSIPKIDWVISIIESTDRPSARRPDKPQIQDLLPHESSGISEDRILRLKIKDSERINYLAWFPKICAFIHEARTTAAKNLASGAGPNGGVLVHCYRGVSRSVTAVMAYLMWAQHYNPVEAFHVVSDRRAAAWPNKEFFSQLNIWHMTDFHIVDDGEHENPIYTEYYVDKQLRPAVELDEYGRNPNAEAIFALADANMPRPAPSRQR